MKRRFLWYALVLSTFAAMGCPIYNDVACSSDDDCAYGQSCGSSGRCGNGNGRPSGVECVFPTDCLANTTCGNDNRCHSGDCANPGTGCVSGYLCAQVGAVYQCVAGDGGVAPSDSGTDGSHANADAGPSTEAGSDGSSDGATALVRCGHPSDCAAGATCAADGVCHAGDCGETPCINGFVCAASGQTLACVHGNPLGCGSDTECTNAGRCIDGLCTAANDLCSDGSQCPAVGEVCVDGRCVKGCTNDNPCGTAFRCQLALGACTTAATPCASTSACATTDVCVDGACVVRCGAGGQCPGGSVCVDNGCKPFQKILHACSVDGSQSSCAAGSVCLHSSCYLPCDAADGGACSSQVATSVCKAITTSSGAHAVCGTAVTLGAECDPTAGMPCASSGVCVDGFCKQP